ncbi:FKBP-type peptidyl-prolyl cis-trans isomerase [Thermomonas paludicola]|uniref:FKBP-type peptidyl-prolyl cis-trans isomerase n=1 Tax=Thermomonas paludicola TaxID=2884874 RepID=UPI0021142AA1|nr:FKBP-type peptidyl-prolyl cis-trans isomerase [Thermomonas paludicola]
MKLSTRTTVLAVATMLALSACKAEQKPIDVSTGSAESGKAATDKTGYPGLPTEKEQVSYSIGMAMGKQLSEIKDEVNVDTVVKALRTQMTGGKALINDEQAQQIMQGFGQKMQAKQIAKMMEEAKANAAKSDQFLAENAKKDGVVTTASGLQYQVITQGKGAKPAATDGVKVNYKGTLLNGTEFDSSYKRGEPAVLPLQGVIPGWAEGLQLMQVGSKYKFWIPAKLAYGEQAPPMIGPNQALEFEVELLEIVKAPAGK